MPPPDPIDARLKRWREEMKFTQLRAAKWWGVPLRTYLDAETGAHTPKGFGRAYLERTLPALPPEPETKPETTNDQ